MSPLLPTWLKYRLGTLPEKLRLQGYELCYHLRKPLLPRNNSAHDQQYSLSAQQIYGDARLPGVSGYYRLYDEEDFLAASVESHLPFFDELILVHDRTTADNTPAIAQALAEKYPGRLQYHRYEPAAHKPRTTAYRMLPANHPESFVNYYNFALSKTTRRVVSKVDGDHIAIDTAFARAAEKFQSMDFMRDVFYAYAGINLWSYEGRLYVDPASPVTAVGDIGFYAMRAEKRYYTKAWLYEDGYFSRKNRALKNAGCLFFHLKNMRRRIPHHSDRGEDDAVYAEKFRRRLREARRRWLDWPAFVRQSRERFLVEMATDLAELPDPNDYLRARLERVPTFAAAATDNNNNNNSNNNNHPHFVILER